MSEVNEGSPSEQTPSVNEAEVPREGPAVAPRHWSLWIAAGLLGGVLCSLLTGLVLTRGMVDLPERGSGESSGELAPLTEEELAENRGIYATNIFRTLVAGGAGVVVSFALFGGLRYRKMGRGVVAGLVGLGVLALIAFFASSGLLKMEENASVSPTRTDHWGMGLHAAEWIVIGLGVATAIGALRGSLGSGGQVAFLFAVAAAVGGVGYVMLGGLIDAEHALHYALPSPGNSFYIWTFGPPVVAGLLLSRAQA